MKLFNCVGERMELVNTLKDIDNLRDNQIIGRPKIVSSSINFNGKNNILYCEDNVELFSATISFNGNNSLIYLSSSSSNYPLKLMISNGSTVFIGRDNVMIHPLNINVQENQNVIIGSDCSMGSGVTIRTSDAHPLYDSKTKQRINFPKSVYIGDHVCLGHLAYISKGVKIGSGSIVDNNAFVNSYSKIYSNSFSVGNPARIVKNDVFFLKEFIGHYSSNETLNSKFYKSNVFIYEVTKNETLNIEEIDVILKNLNIEERLEFVKKLFVQNKRRNRFAIK